MKNEPYIHGNNPEKLIFFTDGGIQNVITAKICGENIKY